MYDGLQIVMPDFVPRPNKPNDLASNSTQEQTSSLYNLLYQRNQHNHSIIRRYVRRIRKYTCHSSLSLKQSSSSSPHSQSVAATQRTQVLIEEHWSEAKMAIKSNIPIKGYSQAIIGNEHLCSRKGDLNMIKRSVVDGKEQQPVNNFFKDVVSKVRQAQRIKRIREQARYSCQNKQAPTMQDAQSRKHPKSKLNVKSLVFGEEEEIRGEVDKKKLRKWDRTVTEPPKQHQSQQLDNKFSDDRLNSTILPPLRNRSEQDTIIGTSFRIKQLVGVRNRLIY